MRLYASSPSTVDLRTQLVHDGRPSTRVVLSGELDICTTPDLVDVLHRARCEGVGAVTVEMSAVSFCGVDVIGVFENFRTRLRSEGREFTLVGVTPHLGRILRLAGAGDLLADRA